MSVTVFNGNPSATIISNYNPINNTGKTNLIPFYNELFYLVHFIPKHNIRLICRYMSAQIGKDENSKFSSPISSNGNEQHLTELSLKNRLTFIYSKFQKRD